MSDRTKGPWVIYDDTNNLHVKIMGKDPRFGGAHVADVLDLANAAAIVRWENSHDALVKALKLALLFIDPDEPPSPISNRVAAEAIRDALAKAGS